MNTKITTHFLKERAPILAILPVGATEQHSGHLPLSTDTVIVERVAEEVAKILHGFTMPSLPYSISQMHRGLPGSFWIRNRTLQLVLNDLAEGVLASGFEYLLILNSHGGNVLLQSVVQDLSFDHPRLLSFTLNTYDEVENARLFPSEIGLSHAGEYETSLFLHLYPDEVIKTSMEKNPTELAADSLRYNAFSEISRLTHTGNPTLASAEKGKQIFGFMIDRIVRESQRIIDSTLGRRKAMHG